MLLFIIIIIIINMDTLKELERILLIYKYLANTYEIIARDYCEICSVPMSNTFCNTMNSIISSFNKLIIFFKQMCHEQYKLSDYAIEQCDVNEKFLLNLLKLIENTQHNKYHCEKYYCEQYKQYEKYIDSLMDSDNIIKFKSIVSYNKIIDKYAYPHLFTFIYENNKSPNGYLAYIDGYAIVVFNKKYVPKISNNYFESKYVIYPENLKFNLTNHHMNYIYLLDYYLLDFINDKQYSNLYKLHSLFYILRNMDPWMNSYNYYFNTIDPYVPHRQIRLSSNIKHYYDELIKKYDNYYNYAFYSELYNMKLSDIITNNKN